MTGLGQQTPGFLTIESRQILRLGRIQLLHVQPPLWQGTRDGPGDEAALVEFQRLQPCLPIDRQERARRTRTSLKGAGPCACRTSPVQVLVLEDLQLRVGLLQRDRLLPASRPVVCTKSTFPVRSRATRAESLGVICHSMPST